jgi:lipoprotein-releasing system permease protein
MGFIESILEISSYHIRAQAPFSDIDDDEDRGHLIYAAIPSISAVPGVEAVAPFREFHGIIQGPGGAQQVGVIRGLPPDALEIDLGLAAKLRFEEGDFAVSGDREIVLGAEMSRRLFARLGDQITIVSVAGLFGDEEEAEDFRFTVTGIFRSDFYEYDLTWAFINLDAARQLSGGEPVLGVKLRNRWHDLRILALIQDLPETQGLELSSWRDYNRAFFSALRTEKLLMFVLVGLIFIVVGLNIFQAQRRVVFERREEIGLFRALGAGERAVRLVFVWDGFIIGLVGASIGLVLGLLVANYINKIIEAWNYFTIFALNAQQFAVFPRNIFYIREIPSRIIPYEVALIFLFGFLSAVLSSWFASGKISKTRPAEVLRYE